MTIRNLHHALEPRTLALIAGTGPAGRLGRVVSDHVRAGGFEGPVWRLGAAVGEGTEAHADPGLLPGAPDLAVVAAAPDEAVAIVAGLAACGARAAVVLGEDPEWDEPARQALREAARPALLRVIGPGSAGLMVPALGLNASLAPTLARPGKLALVSQSGAIASGLVEWAADRGIGFSHVVSLGAMADVDLGDYLDLLAGDRRTTAILAYLETITAARKFMSAARAAARLKPVVMIKAGRHPASRAAAATHTGSLVAADAVVDAALRRAGVLRVGGLDQLFDAAEVMGRLRPLPRGRLAIVTNSGAAGVLALDGLLDLGGEVAALGTAGGAARENPIDLDAEADPERYRAAMEAAMADPGADAVLVMNCATGLADPRGIARAVAASAGGGSWSGKPLLACWLGGAAAREARRELREAGIATYDTPAAAAGAVAHLTEWGRAQAALLRVPDRGDAALCLPAGARERVGEVLRTAVAQGRETLGPAESLDLLAAYGIPVCPAVLAPDAEAVAAAAAGALEGADAVAVKLVAPEVPHKSSVGGVVLNLASPVAAAEAARAIAARLARRRPGSLPEGFLVQPMVRRAQAEELILGIGRDAVFGPVLLFGAGGVTVEATGDTALALPPLDRTLAADLVGRTRIGRVVESVGAVGADAVHAALVALSNLTEDFPAIRALDVNPLIADGEGVLALDARVVIDPALVGLPGPNPAFAIRPYPAAWTRTVSLGDAPFVLRAIRPTDAFLYPEFLARLAPEAIRMRFLAPRKQFPDEMGLRLTQLDYDRDMAFVALAGDGSLAGVARLACQPGRDTAEYALIVRSDLGGRGLGTALMEHLIAYARSEGVRGLEGSILAENRAMIGLVTRLGFRVERDPDDASLVTSRLAL
jgi:acetyltransferase